MLKLVAILALVASLTFALHGAASAAPPDPCKSGLDDDWNAPV
jgi:hypothetical protein